MNTSTHTIELEASPDAAFDFLSRVENLPRWATQFCKGVRTDETGLHRVMTPDGEILFRVEADTRTGVIDMHGGPDPHTMAFWPARVVSRPGGGSLFIFTAMQQPVTPDEEFAAQCAGLDRELARIRELLDGQAAA